MADFRSADMTEVAKMVADFKAAREKLEPALRKATVAAGKEVQRKARELAPRSPTVPRYPSTITSRIARSTTLLTQVVVESRSPFGHILEYGAGRSGPHPHFGPAFDAQVEPLVKAIEGIAEDVFGS